MSTPVGRIVREYIFRDLSEHKTALTIHGHHTEFEGIILEISRETLLIEIINKDDITLKKGDNLRIFFYFNNKYHTFEELIIDIDASKITVTNSENLHRDPSRKFQRINPSENSTISFSLAPSEKLYFPKLNCESKKPVLMIPTAFLETSSKPKDLIHDFQKETFQTISNFKITMLNNKNVSTIQEKLLANTGKILWLPSVDQEFPLFDPFPEDRIIIQPDLKTVNQTKDQTVIVNKLYNDAKDRKIISELFCPILYQDYLAGYIQLSTSSQKNEQLTEKTVNYTHEFSQVFSSALENEGYFDNPQKEKKLHEAKIVNYSASGILFNYEGKSISEAVQNSQTLTIFLTVDNTSIRIRARIVRQQNHHPNNLVGVEFLSMTPESFIFLYKHLYGKSYSHKEQGVLEGGNLPG